MGHFVVGRSIRRVGEWYMHKRQLFKESCMSPLWSDYLIWNHQWIFFEGINSQIINSSSDSRNTTVYFLLYGIHLYPIRARSGSRHIAWILRESASFMKKSYTLSANFSAVATKPLDSIYQAISAILSATDSLMITSRWTTFWLAFYYGPVPPWWLAFFPACSLELPFFAEPDSFLLVWQRMIYFRLQAYSYPRNLYEYTNFAWRAKGEFRLPD